MKRLIIILFFNLLCIYGLTILFAPIGSVLASTKSYAQVLQDNVYLYRTPTDSEIIENKYFLLERTYFVELLSVANNLFYKAKYMDITGYVKISEVQCVEGIPNKPYMNDITFRVYGESSMTIRSAPISSDTDQTFVCDLAQYTYITYYGKIHGDMYTLGRTNMWYYCKYNDSKTYYGYIYSDNTDEMTTKLLNDEHLPFISEPTFLSAGTTTIQKDAKNAIIILLSIPSLIFIFMIIRGSTILYADKSAKQKSNQHEISEF